MRPARARPVSGPGRVCTRDGNDEGLEADVAGKAEQGTGVTARAGTGPAATGQAGPAAGAGAGAGARPAAQRWALALSSAASFLVVLDSLVVATALTSIGRDLGSSLG